MRLCSFLFAFLFLCQSFHSINTMYFLTWRRSSLCSTRVKRSRFLILLQKNLRMLRLVPMDQTIVLPDQHFANRPHLARDHQDQDQVMILKRRPMHPESQLAPRDSLLKKRPSEPLVCVEALLQATKNEILVEATKKVLRKYWQYILKCRVI